MTDTDDEATEDDNKENVVMFSGGIGSYATAKRVTDPLLLCANTNTEAGDWLPFVNACADSLDARLVMLDNAGQDIWDVFQANRFIGNTRADLCSRVLKREPLRAWLEYECDPAHTVVHLGFDWTEVHRFERARPHWHPWQIAAPLCDPPYLQKAELLAELEADGIPVPGLYKAGFSHNNCAGACVKAGQAQWRKLWHHDPDTYRHHERKEQETRVLIGSDVSILRDRTGGTVKPLTLEAFRERITAQPSLFDADDWGSCSCMGN